MNTTMGAAHAVDRNNHVREYLAYYISLPYPPRYAVLLDGKWGIGKTFLIKELLKKHFGENKKNEYIYLSLYGLTSIEEIDEALMAAIYPPLAWKGMKIAGRVVKSAIKYAGVEIDVKSGDLLSRYKAKLYVFDDLERCELPINKVLGYINEFVEHDDCKVLIIANEIEIPNVEEYRWRREKLIGKTLEVQSSFEAALDHFISQIDDSETKAFMQKKSEEVSAIYHQSDLQNLRILQQTMWDFERVFRVLSLPHRTNDIAMTDLLQMFFALSFEVKSGRIVAADLTSRMSSLVAALARFDHKDTDPTPLQLAQKRYPETELSNSMLSDELLIDILSRGIVNTKDIHESLDRSSYFVTQEDEPAWRVVWYSLERTDEHFNRAFAEMERQFSEREFSVTGEILHVFGLRLWLSDIGVLSKSRPEVVLEGKRYVDDLYAHKRLEPIPDHNIGEFNFDSYGGLGMREAATPEYRELYAYLKSKRHQAKEDHFPDHANELLKELETDPDLYFRRLCFTNSDDNTYYRVPVLASIDPEVFVDLVLKQTPSHQRTILMAFKARYDHGHLERELLTEKPWLVSVRNRLISAAAAMSAMGKYRIETTVRWFIEPFLKESVQDDTEKV